MPIELQIIRAAEFVRIGGEGKFDLAASCGILANLAEACKRRGVNRALVDARNAQAELSPKELAALVEVFHEIGFPKNQRLAILHSGDPYRRARTFASISRMKGWSVRAFGDFEKALDWLSGDLEKTEQKATSSAKRLHVAHSDADEKRISIKAHPNRKSEHVRSAAVKPEEMVSRAS